MRSSSASAASAAVAVSVSMAVGTFLMGGVLVSGVWASGAGEVGCEAALGGGGVPSVVEGVLVSTCVYCAGRVGCVEGDVGGGGLRSVMAGVLVSDVRGSAAGEVGCVGRIGGGRVLSVVCAVACAAVGGGLQLRSRAASEALPVSAAKVLALPVSAAEAAMVSGPGGAGDVGCMGGEDCGDDEAFLGCTGGEVSAPPKLLAARPAWGVPRGRAMVPPKWTCVQRRQEGAASRQTLR